MRKGKALLAGTVWKYIAVAAVVVFVWISVFQALGRIKDNERLAIEVYNADVENLALRDELAGALPGMTGQHILELYVDDVECSPGQTYADEILTAQLLHSDLVIMPEDLLGRLDMKLYFAELPEPLKSGWPEDRYYVFDGKRCGILLDDESPFAKYCRSEGRFYLLLSGASVNLDGLNGRGEKGDDAALQALYYLAGEGLK